MTKLLNTVATRIQTRLSRKGLKVALGEIKDYLKVNVADVENIADSDVNLATDYFMTNATQLTVINETVEELSTEVDSVDSLETVGDDLAGDDLAIAPNTPEELEEFYKHPALFTPNEDDQPAPLATATQSQLITTTADQMGIVLDASEISLIAENINDSTDTLEQDIDAIRSAIIAFVEHKALVNQSKINEMISEVRQVVGEKNQENSQLLSDGLRSINSDIQEANKQFKSNVKKALSAFTIPAIKAG